VLPAAARLTSGESFRRCIRTGHRAGSRTLVLHLAAGGDPTPGLVSGATSPQVGFVVSRAVGNAVVRNRVRRRLRHLVRDRLPGLSVLPEGAVIVVRALPAAAGASYDELRRDLARCLERVQSRVQTQPAAHDGGAMVPR
jgi:ribonuclease P protein component